MAVLPYSGYAYTEAFLDMKQEAWITGYVGAYRYFGGVTRILTPDNLKTGVPKNSKNKTVLNKSYQEMAEYNGTAILPARPRSPKDKAFVEGAVGVASTWTLAALRNQQFLPLTELNQAIQGKLELFNRKPFQKREGSRAACTAEEKLFLLHFPAAPFELAVWKVATVQYNYYISVERMNYFVPYEYIEQQGYKSCMALLKLEDCYSSQRLESACREALSYTTSPSLKSVQIILKSGQDKLLAEDAPTKPEEYKAHKFTRGADYYKRGGMTMLSNETV